MLKSALLILAFLMSLEACTSTGGGRQSDSSTELPPAESKCQTAIAGLLKEATDDDNGRKYVTVTPTYTPSAANDNTGLDKLDLSCTQDADYDIFKMIFAGAATTPKNPDEVAADGKIESSLACDPTEGVWYYKEAANTVTEVSCEEIKE